MKKSIIGFTLATVLSSAFCDEIVFHTVSIHTSPTYQKRINVVSSTGASIQSTQIDIPFNNNNYGLGYRVDSGWEAGYYYNSYRKSTMYISKELMMTDSFGGVFGAGTGYEEVTGSKINVLGGLLFKYKMNEKFTLNTVVVPPLFSAVGVVHFELSYKLK